MWGEFQTWWADVKFSGSDLISGFALVVSIGALWISWHFGRPQRELARVTLRKEDDAAEKSKSASIKCRLMSAGPSSYVINFGNRGPAEARNIQIDADHDPELDALFGNEHVEKFLPHRRLYAHDSFNVPVSIYMESPERYTFFVCWDDDTGVRKREEQSVSMLG